jgi:hypothetical protein
MNLLFTCEQCGVAVDDDNIGCVENNWCDECMDKWCNEQVARWWPVFTVEREYMKLAEEYGKPEGNFK